MNHQQINIPFKDDKTLALWKVYDAKTSKGKHIFLAHGTFSNRKVCLAISEFLVNNGYTCWILEWRNHGESSKVEGPYNFEIIGKEDFVAAFDYLFKVEKIEQLDCITHSGGGISLTIFLIENSHITSKINKIVFFACQTSGAGQIWLNRFKIRIGQLIGKVTGHLPACWLGRPENEDYSFMKQWFDWNLSDQFIGGDGKNYRLEMPTITNPILAIAGAGDRFIAPMAGCQAFLSRFKNPNNKFLSCGKATGFAETYNHSRLIYSRNAEREIYPKVLDWLK